MSNGPQERAFTRIPNSKTRKVIAKRLGESKREIPHYYLSVDFRLDALLALLETLNGEAEGEARLSINDCIVKACALALKAVPEVNVSWGEDAIRQYHDVDICVAVATERGLITPIVRNADEKPLAAISKEIRDLAARARAGRLQPHEYQGGGFTLSNLGMYGVREFAAIVNLPQSCILAVGAAEQRPVVTDGELGIATLVSCTLSVDHRSVDGVVGARFLQSLKNCIEQPEKMTA